MNARLCSICVVCTVMHTHLPPAYDDDALSSTVILGCTGILLTVALLLAAFLSPDGIGKEFSGDQNEDWTGVAMRMIDGDSMPDVLSPPVDYQKCIQGLRRISPTFYAGAHYPHNDSRFAELTYFWMTAAPANASTPIVAPQIPNPAGGECCVILLNGLRLRSNTEDFINPANGQGLTPAFTLGAFLSANDQVRSALGESKTFIKTFHLVNEVMTSSNNKRNEIFFAQLTNIPGSLRIVAISIVYFICTDFNDATNQCVGELAIETHKIIFNVKQFTFGDATQQKQVMDFASIAAHEFLHPQGVGDFTGASCQEATMFATADTGETKKRSFHSSDIQCLQSLYEQPITGKSMRLSAIGALFMSFALCSILF